ncbi:chemotaxis protein CheA [Paludibacterium yongneupense]|uniref:chemotaxis protein CheA n=1 Tax=Paludibacterium yongneupense TaxID=400061 RepID=UPI000426383F|nr:chemotaxis protein CheA [Paludibacterium yongneupense]
MTLDMELALQTFFEESNELLSDMERILLDVEMDATTPEQLNALFRAMHTIKGSAGLFALDDVVRFTHQVENALDHLRDGSLQLDEELAGLLLRCHDHVKTLLDALAAKEALPVDAGLPLLEELSARLNHGAAPQPSAEPAPAEAAAPSPAEARASAWLISLRLGPDVLRNGMDPASFIRYLHTMGRIERIEAISVKLPAGAAFDPESNYLRLELIFAGEVEIGALWDAFEFAREDSRIHIWPLDEAPAHLAELSGEVDAAEAAALQAVWQRFGLPDATAPAIEAVAAPAAVETAAAVTPRAESGKAVHAEARQPKPPESKFIKVEAGKLDSLINLIGELVIAGAAANLMARRADQTPLVEATLAISSLIEQIRAGTLSMRMIQIGEIFNRFPRVVRDVSRELGKDIQLTISGADTELDKSMVDKLGDPLMHIVRNAIDHGIEDTAQRRAAGKPDTGTIWLNAYHESGSVVIEVADDGGGLRRDRILAKAVERNLVPADATLSDQEIFKLIFEPGFSTAEQVTNLSGRGVGMDVVRKSIEQLRGSVDIDSEPQLGSTFRIRLPLTLAIIDGFLVQNGDATFVVPLEAVIECIELPPAQQQEGTHDCLNLRGEILPLLHLSTFFELGAAPGKRQNVVVVRFGDSKAGLVVDELLGEYQTVIKPLGSLFRHLKAISGSTILGTGEVALILDIPSLIHYATRKESERYSPDGEAGRRSRTGSPS